MSRFDKIKESFSILQTQKEKSDVSEETTRQAVSVKEESVEEELQKYFEENPRDILQVNDTKTRQNDGQRMRITNSKRLRAYEPIAYSDVKIIGEEIRNGKIVLVNFKNLSEDDSIRVENFLYGMCYALDIEPEPIESGIISFDPQHSSDEK